MTTMQRFGMVLVAASLLLLNVSAPALAGGDWYVEFFNNNGLNGAAVRTQYAAEVNFDWKAGSPGSEVPADNFSARLVRDAWFDGGNYRFNYAADDGIRLWVDDQLVVERWQDGSGTWRANDRYIGQGTHRVRIEYYERSGSALLKVNWEKVSSGDSWRGDYFANTGLAGNPTLTRNDAAIDFDWGVGSPDAKIPADNFTVRWTRTVGLEAGTYRFYASTDDGVRIYVDGHKVVSAWQKQQLPNTHTGDMALGAGAHTIVVEYYEEGGQAAAHVWWNKLGVFTGWEGRYYDNRELRGGPALVRDDAEINFDWGEGAPSTWMPSDNFSASWTRRIEFKPGLYRFNTRVDDGMRLWIDNVTVHMSHWEPQDNVWHYQDWHYLEGTHTLRVEYFEQAGGARIQFWWDYAATPAAAQAMAPSPVYGFPTASTPTNAATPVPSVPPTAPVLPANGPWQAQYFGNRSLSGDPAITREETAINHNWGDGVPLPGMPADEFSVRWSGTFAFEGGRYTFNAIADNGIRLYVDERMVIDAWQERSAPTTQQGVIQLAAGQHSVRVEYYEASQNAQAQVAWTRAGGITAGNTGVPTPRPSTPGATPSPVQAASGPWNVRYYANESLSGDPIVSRNGDSLALDFDWGRGSPDPQLPADRFSATWEQTRAFEPGRYRFTVTSDDGMRLYVNGQLVLQQWRAWRGTRSVTLDIGGDVGLRLEYFERTGNAHVKLTWQKL